MAKRACSGSRRNRRSKGRVSSHPVLAQQEINKNCSTIQDEVNETTTASSNITENAIILYDPSTATVQSSSQRKSVVIKEDHQIKTSSTLLHD